ncbi:MAG: molybdenum cofactor biosynthesis protein MoaE [Alphaproteobacteria bacterium]|nr:molybdenum cofactor biosynthesis protein MoaE [Alphaproteobacteria bacterium]
MIRVEVTERRLDVASEIAALQAEGADGALAVFAGACRPTGANGAPVRELALEHYPGFTEKEIARIAGAIVAGLPPVRLVIRHRVGAIAPGETIVIVAATSAHRAAAFACVEQVMDYLKSDAPFWKRERRTDGDHWIEPTAEDLARRAQWEDTI